MGEDGLWHLHCSGMYGPHKPDNSSAHGLSSSGRGITMHLSDVWLGLGVLQGIKAGILTTETLTMTLFQFGKCFLLQQFHLCTTPPSLSLFPPFPLSPDAPTSWIPYLLNAPFGSKKPGGQIAGHNFRDTIEIAFCVQARWLQWQRKQCLLELSKREFLSTSFCLETHTP